jgi:type IV secretory pathway TraG/TraD family ATPase VirD4
VVVIDPKGDLVEDVLKRLPDERTDDVILLDPADRDRPVPFNVMAGAHRDPELASDQVLATFHKLWQPYWGPRTQDYLHAALLTMCAEEGSTLIDLPMILTHDEFRHRAVRRLDDPMLLHFWAAYDDMSAPERSNAIGAPLSRMRQLLLRPSMRAILGQAVPTFSMEEVLNNQKVLLVSLPTGLIGEEAASLIGSLIMARLSQAIYARAGLPTERRFPAFVYLDEFQAFTHLPTGLGNLLAQARGLGAGFTLAHQHLGQLSADLRHAVSANARSKVVFQSSATDAAVLARELGGAVRPEDVMGLPAFEAIAALMAGGQVARPATIRTRPLAEPTSDGRVARAASRRRYGRDRAEVEAAIKQRQEGPLPDGPTLRRKRGGS